MTHRRCPTNPSGGEKAQPVALDTTMSARQRAYRPASRLLAAPTDDEPLGKVLARVC